MLQWEARVMHAMQYQIHPLLRQHAGKRCRLQLYESDGHGWGHMELASSRWVMIGPRQEATSHEDKSRTARSRISACDDAGRRMLEGSICCQPPAVCRQPSAIAGSWLLAPDS